MIFGEILCFDIPYSKDFLEAIISLFFIHPLRLINKSMKTLHASSSSHSSHVTTNIYKWSMLSDLPMSSLSSVANFLHNPRYQAFFKEEQCKLISSTSLFKPSKAYFLESPRILRCISSSAFSASSRQLPLPHPRPYP